MLLDQRIRRAKSVAVIFEVVKDMVSEYFGSEQAGLLVGLSDLGSFGSGFIGAFYSPDANTIVINKRPLAVLMQTRPELYNYYLFHVVLHEYIHSIGAYDEGQTRYLVEEISKYYFGPQHMITQFAVNMEKFVPDLQFPDASFEPPEDLNIDFVLGIDKKNTNYIN
jgi:hypothetical protein